MARAAEERSKSKDSAAQHFIHDLAPGGMAGFVTANGSMGSNQSGEGDIRRSLIEAALVDSIGPHWPALLQHHNSYLPLALVETTTASKACDGEN